MAFLDASGVTYLVTQLKTRFAAISHVHAASDITSGTLAIANGGTGATTAADAAANIVNGQAIAPESVGATGDVMAYVGVSGLHTHSLTSKANCEAIANQETLPTTAYDPHAVGDYITHNGHLYRVIAPIAVGDEFTDANITLVRVMDEATNASRITSGTLALDRGGTGQSGTSAETNVSSIVTAASGCSIASNGAKYYQWGKVAQIYLAITCSSAKSADAEIATVSNDKRPPVTTALMNTSNPSQSCGLGADGKVKIKAAVTAGTTIYVVGTYLLA